MKHLFTVLALLTILQAHAQYSEWLNSDRPGTAMSPYTVGDQVLQLQAGYSFTQLKYEHYSGSWQAPGDIAQTTSNAERAKFRLGIAKQVEINVAMNYATDITHYEDTDQPNSKSNYFERVEVGFRGCFLMAKGYRPAIGLELRMLFPTPQDDYSDLFFSSTLSVQEAFSDKFSLTANVIYTQRYQIGLALNASYQITQKLGVFAEIAPNYDLNLSSDGGTLTRAGFINGGASWYLSRNFQFDLATSWVYNAGKYFNSTSKVLDRYISIQAGFTGRIDWRK